MTSVTVRVARPDEYAAIGEMTVEVYRDLHGGQLDEYELVLRDVEKRARDAEVYVAVDEAGTVVGSVAFATHGSEYAEMSGPGEAVFRMLAVSPSARGKGVGRDLVQLCVARARELGLDRLRLSTRPFMHDAHRLYERMGFVRTPKSDWAPRPGIDLITYAMELRGAEFCDRCGAHAGGDHSDCTAARALEPPRYCADCGRRMTVQVTPTGWTATCVEHGVRQG